MRLSVATNFDDDLILGVGGYPVTELYGKLPADPVGGGRSSYMLAPLSRRALARHVALARKHGIGFNYLLNAACLDNMEATRRGQKGLRRLLDWISEIGVTAVTLSNPLLLRTVKARYPQLKVRVSVFAGVDHLRRARYWQDIGADVICLDSLTVNREFRTLGLLRRSLSCDLELLVNNSCLQSCSLSQTHMNLLAHSSQSDHASRGFVIDHCILECSRLKMTDPVNFIRADWIRPEDLHHYEAIGYDRFKLVERNLPTPVMLTRVRAYSERRYDGNLVDLIQPYGHCDDGGSRGGRRLRWSLSFLLRPSKVRIRRLGAIRELVARKGMLGPLRGEPPVFIDNRSLDGFIDRFLRQGCRDLSCDECRYCHEYADRAVRVDPAYREDCLRLHRAIDKDLESGALWL
ncbi:MAG: U32 family peptidase [Acidobacteriota bacterium]